MPASDGRVDMVTMLFMSACGVDAYEDNSDASSGVPKTVSGS